MALVFFQGKDPAHAARMRGEEGDPLWPDEIGKVIDDRVMAAGDEEGVLPLQ